MAALQEAQERLQSSVSSLQVHRLSCMTLNSGNTRISRQALHSSALYIAHKSRSTEWPLDIPHTSLHPAMDHAGKAPIPSPLDCLLGRAS